MTQSVEGHTATARQPWADQAQKRLEVYEVRFGLGVRGFNRAFIPGGAVFQRSAQVESADECRALPKTASPLGDGLARECIGLTMLWSEPARRRDHA